MSNAPRTHRVPIPETGFSLAVHEWPGEGPPALLHHANGFCGALWGPVAELLRPHFRVFAVDARGHGDSDAPRAGGDAAFAWSTLAHDLEAVGEWVLAQTRAPRIGLGLGHSFGGTLTLAVAAARPHLYERALLVDPVILPRPDSAARRLRAGGNPLAERARKRRHHWKSREAARAYLAEKPLFASWQPRLLDLYVEQAMLDSPDGGVELKCAGRVEAAVFEGATGFDPYAVAAAVRVPVRLVRASRGDFPRAHYDDLVAQLAAGEVGEIEGGHLVVMERPEAVAREALRFANRAARPQE